MKLVAADMGILELSLAPGQWVPNNQELPVLIYRGTFSKADAASGFDTLFGRNDWTGIWRNGVYNYHHYHTRAHEVLGIATGVAKLMIGGPEGREVEVSAGDCFVLPAGTGHCNTWSSADFAVVGAYPPGQHADIQTSAPDEDQLQAIKDCPVPRFDPIEGPRGYLTRSWRSG